MQLTMTVHRHDPVPLGWGNCDGGRDCPEVVLVGEVSEEAARVLSVDGVPADRLDVETASQAEECLWLESERRQCAAGGAR